MGSAPRVVRDDFAQNAAGQYSTSVTFGPVSYAWLDMCSIVCAFCMQSAVGQSFHPAPCSVCSCVPSNPRNNDSPHALSSARRLISHPCICTTAHLSLFHLHNDSSHTLLSARRHISHPFICTERAASEPSAGAGGGRQGCARCVGEGAARRHKVSVLLPVRVW